jgi:ataxia telangiectasia mutated family protein
LDPNDWYEKQRSYTKSVATNSIIGYLLGLGDRHSFNILLDKKSAEVIHIDLGIAFDQGKLLSIPEVVPFRLTRDIVNGMGPLGVEGIFRRCSEETMNVLRKESEMLLMILQVTNGNLNLGTEA